MWNIPRKKLKYLFFYYFCLYFLTICIGFDIYMGTVTGFTFGYGGAFVYMWLRLQEAKELLKGDEDE